MKSSVVMFASVLASGLCSGQEVGRVISSTPVVQQVAVPRQICGAESGPVGAQRSGAGAALGAIAGGAVGNAVGQGSGRAVATMIGIFGGAVLGDQIEGQGATQFQRVQRCTTQSFIENRVAHYSVVYEYAGKQYVVQMPYDPGPSVKLQITPVDAAPAAAAPVVYAAPVVTQVLYPQPVYVAVAPPWYPPHYGHRYGPPIDLSLQFGYGNRHHGPWR